MSDLRALADHLRRGSGDVKSSASLEPEVREFSGPQVADVEQIPGVYAWYYVPDVSLHAVESKVLPVLHSLVHEQRSAYLRISDLYRMELIGEATLLRTPLNETSVREAIDPLISNSDLVKKLILSHTFVTRFCRPIYIGISKMLRTRAYETHYLDLDQYWDPSSAISRLLASAKQPPTVDEASEELGLKHTFALEARVRGIRTRDLLLQVLYIRDGSLDAFADESPPLREIERLLHLLSFPVCGRT